MTEQTFNFSKWAADLMNDFDLEKTKLMQEIYVPKVKEMFRDFFAAYPLIDGISWAQHHQCYNDETYYFGISCQPHLRCDNWKPEPLQEDDRDDLGYQEPDSYFLVPVPPFKRDHWGRYHPSGYRTREDYKFIKEELGKLWFFLHDSPMEIFEYMFGESKVWIERDGDTIHIETEPGSHFR